MATILVVEGYQPNRKTLSSVLTSAHHRVVEAGDGVEALAKLRAEPIDLVICDILMPPMDGYEFVCQLRGDPDLADTRLVFCMATFDTPEAKLFAESCGVRHILPRLAEASKVIEVTAAALGEPPSVVLRKRELDDDHVRLLLAKLKRAAKDMDARRAVRPVRPILVVEDNPMDLDFMIQAFEENNVANPVCICRDGEEAMWFIAAHVTPEDPNLPLMVLLDLRLPKVDGIEVLRQARQHPVWKQIPFIVVTTSREDSDISLAYGLGVNSYIVKPMNFGAFVEVVKNIKVYWLLTNEPPFSEHTGRPSCP